LQISSTRVEDIIDKPAIHQEAKIIVADDHELTRESIRTMLESVASKPYFRILSEARDGQESIELCRLQRPDLVLMDVGMPKVNGFEATQIIKAELPTIKVLMMSVHFDPFLVSEVERAGADGYVTKLCSVQELVDAMWACFEASLNTLEVSTGGQCRKPGFREEAFSAAE
jgi:two-component system nitrate/nitrite response regulator NarL